MIFFFILGLLYSAINPVRKLPIHKKWELADGRFLLLREGTICQHMFVYRCYLDTRAYISDGTNEVDFTKTSGIVKLADGRTAKVGDNNYLRVIRSSLESTETHRLGQVDWFLD